MPRYLIIASGSGTQSLTGEEVSNFQVITDECYGPTPQEAFDVWTRSDDNPVMSYEYNEFRLIPLTQDYNDDYGYSVDESKWGEGGEEEGYWIAEPGNAEEHEWGLLSFPTLKEAVEYAEVTGNDNPIRRGKGGPIVDEAVS
jgi:hypothetical protein